MSLCNFVTIGLGGVGVKANLVNVTKSVGFFCRLLLGTLLTLSVSNKILMNMSASQTSLRRIHVVNFELITILMNEH